MAIKINDAFDHRAVQLLHVDHSLMTPHGVYFEIHDNNAYETNGRGIHISFESWKRIVEYIEGDEH